MTMIIHGKHVRNALFWIGIIGYLVFQSIHHTIDGYNASASKAMNEYKAQANARMVFLNQIDHSLPRAQKQTLIKAIQTIRNQANPYQVIELNNQLTLFIDANTKTFDISSSQLAQLQAIQQRMKEEAMIVFAHSESFNHLIARVPYRWFSMHLAPIPSQAPPPMMGVLVNG
jgi:hypothetical protein